MTGWGNRAPAFRVAPSSKTFLSTPGHQASLAHDLLILVCNQKRFEMKPQHDYNKRFPLWHCLLYYLNWYERSTDKWDDLKRCLEMDGYSGMQFSNYDVTRLVLSVADDFNIYCAQNGLKLISVASAIPDEWWIAKYREQGLENPDLMYIVDQMMSKFALDYDRKTVKIPKPDFKKGDPIRYSGYKEGKTYKEANRHASTYTWHGEASDFDWRRYWHPEWYPRKKKSLAR